MLSCQTTLVRRRAGRLVGSRRLRWRPSRAGPGPPGGGLAAGVYVRRIGRNARPGGASRPQWAVLDTRRMSHGLHKQKAVFVRWILWINKRVPRVRPVTSAGRGGAVVVDIMEWTCSDNGANRRAVGGSASQQRGHAYPADTNRKKSRIISMSNLSDPQILYFILYFAHTLGGPYGPPHAAHHLYNA